MSDDYNKPENFGIFFCPMHDVNAFLLGGGITAAIAAALAPSGSLLESLAMIDVGLVGMHLFLYWLWHWDPPQ